MRFLTSKNSVARKILIILLVTLILIFSITPNYSVHAEPEDSGSGERVNEEDLSDGGNVIINSLLKQILQIFAAIGDIAMGLLNYFMLGADGINSTMLSPGNDNLTDPDSWLYAQDVDDSNIDITFSEGTIDTSEFFSWILGTQYDIPNFLYSPENIFANNIAALDVNFLNPNKYAAITDREHAATTTVASNAQKAAESTAGGALRETISDWYVSFRNIAIVGLLCVLVYLGIRILISSTATDKAKYKESLKNWVVAMCLVFFIHIIMSGLLMITDKFTDLISPAIDDGITIKVEDGGENGGGVKFRTNLVGLIRFNAQSKSLYNTAAYTILYLVIVIYTFIFTFMYFKRFLYMAFFTMISPLVALTYPIDKAGDGKAQAFNFWFKEYTMNLVLQPVHLILYIALVSSAMELVKQNMIYAIVAIGFLIPAEKFIKKMFGMDKAETPSGFGSFAAGAATMSGFKHVASMLSGGKGKNGNKGASSADGGIAAGDQGSNKIRTQDRGFLQSFRNGGNENDGARALNAGSDGGETGNENAGGMFQPNQDDNGYNNIEAQNEEHQRMLDDRNEWQNIMNDENTSELDKEEAQQQIDFINEDMRNKGYETGERTPEENVPEQDANNIQPTIQPRRPTWEELQAQKAAREKAYRRKRSIRAAKAVGKVALKGSKIAAQGLGIAAGATAGVIAGTATGDFSNAMAYMGAGAVVGKGLGKAAGNLPERAYNTGKSVQSTAQDKLEEYRYNRDKDMHGVGYAAEQAAIRQNERAEKQFLDSKSEQAKYEEIAGRIKTQTGHDVDTKDLMKAAYDYKKAGITDEKQIETGLTLEAKNNNGIVGGNNHDNVMDVINMTKSYGKDYMIDDKKRASLQGVIKDNIKGEENQNKVWDLYSQALGMEETGRRNAINPPQQVKQNGSQRRQNMRTTSTSSHGRRNNNSTGSNPPPTQTRPRQTSRNDNNPPRPSQN